MSKIEDEELLFNKFIKTLFYVFGILRKRVQLYYFPDQKYPLKLKRKVVKKLFFNILTFNAIHISNVYSSRKSCFKKAA